MANPKLLPDQLDALDAPADGESPSYDAASKKFKWITGGGIPDAPSDGNYYGRLNAAWTNLKTYFDTLYLALTSVTAKMLTLLAETNVKGTFINDALTDGANPDMGSATDSNFAGYYSDVVTDKRLSNVLIGSNARTEEGAVRTTTAGLFQIYLVGQWNDVVVNFVLRENGTYGYTFEHQPVAGGYYIEVMSGNSTNDAGLNGLPIVQGYSVSMGAYPASPIIDGGSF